VKIRSVTFNNRKKGFEVKTTRETYWFPYAKLEVQPANEEKVTGVLVDQELGREGFSYVLTSGKEGTVHIEQVLDYNRDPGYLRELLVQFYRLLDQTNYKKSLGQLLSLLHVLDCDVDLVVRARSA